jgi:hypothetical protein
LSKRNFPDWLKAFVDYASFGEAPLSFYFWTGVSTIAGALRRRVWIDQGYFQWVPNFYVILVAPPGIVSKSTTASIGMNLLRQVKGVKFGPDVVTWQKLAQSLAQSKVMVPIGTVSNEPGLDPLLNTKMMPMSAITIESSEFGTFLNPNDREMVDVLVSLWDGKKGTFVKATKTQGDDVIENPFVNILACTTPSWLEGNFPEYMIGGGFTSRCIFLFADQKRNFIAYPKDHLPTDFLSTGDTLVADLEIISLLRGEYVLSPDASLWGERWYEEHYRNKPPHLDNDRFGGYLARKQTHIHKLAMVLTASGTDDLVISGETLARANALISALEVDMPKVFDRIGTSVESRGAAQLVSLVRTHGKITQAALYRELFRILSYEDFTKSLNSAIQAGHVKSPRSDGKDVWIEANYAQTNPGGVTGNRGGASIVIFPKAQGAEAGTRVPSQPANEGGSVAERSAPILVPSGEAESKHRDSTGAETGGEPVSGRERPASSGE